MDHLAVDLAQLKTSRCGMNYFLAVIDMCTRFCWLYALPDKMGTTVSAALRSLFLSFGVPKIIQSDRGSEFMNLNVAQIMNLAGTEHRPVSAYNPQANGAAERVIRSIKQSLNAQIKGDSSSWPHFLPFIQYCYNTTAHRRHGSTPFSLFFARAHNPFRGETPSRPLPPLTRQQLLARHRFMTEVVFPGNATRTAAYTKRMFDDFAERTNIIANDFPPGALVMRRVNPRESKMSPVWDGPFFVIRRTRGGPYLLRDSLNNQLVEKVPAAHLKLVSYEKAPSPDTYEIEFLVKHKGPPESRSYLVRWKGYTEKDDSWVKDDEVFTRRCIDEYWDKQRQATATQVPTTRSRARAPKRKPPSSTAPASRNLRSRRNA
jgi:transposase InsO family protein